MDLSRRRFVAGGLMLGTAVAVSRVEAAPPAKPSITVYRDPT